MAMQPEPLHLLFSEVCWNQYLNPNLRKLSVFSRQYMFFPLAHPHMFCIPFSAIGAGRKKGNENYDHCRNRRGSTAGDDEMSLMAPKSTKAI